MFLIRTAILVAVVLLLLPIDREEAGIAQGPSTFETFAAVGTIVQDLRGFCGRNPQACATGAATVDVLRQKAVYSAAVVQGWLADEGETSPLHVRHEDDRLPPSQVPDADEVASLIEAANHHAEAVRAPL